MLSKCQTPPGLWLFLLIEPKPALLIWRSPGSMHRRQSTAVNLAPTRSAFMIVQETGDLRLQYGGVVRFARRRVLEEPALDVSSQIIPFADKGGIQTFQDSALHVAQIAGFIG